MVIENKLKSTGYDVAYREFKKSPSIPYIVYYREDDENIASDHKVHGKFKNYIVELYTNEKNETAEKAVESVLEQINPDYTTDEVYVESDELYMVVYGITLTEKR